jgi:hypothetical protein
MIDTSQRAMALLVGAAMAANGLAMIFAGLAWYGAVPGVLATGPFNGHFVKDIGAAYLVTGAGLGWFAFRRGAVALGAALTGTGFLTLHALIHLSEAVGDRDGTHHLARDFAAVLLPPVLGAFALIPRRHGDA